MMGFGGNEFDFSNGDKPTFVVQFVDKSLKKLTIDP